MDYFTSLKPVIGAFDFHSYQQLVLYPYGMMTREVFVFIGHWMLVYWMHSCMQPVIMYSKHHCTHPVCINESNSICLAFSDSEPPHARKISKFAFKTAKAMSKVNQATHTLLTQCWSNSMYGLEPWLVLLLSLLPTVLSVCVWYNNMNIV